MRIALLADIHGNPLALDAVLTDIQSQGGVDETWVLGDLAAIGPDPVGVLERLARLPNAHILRGNTEEYLVHGTLPGPTPEKVLAQPELLAKFQEVAQSFAWTQGVLAYTGWLDWLADLPLERRIVLPDGTHLLAVHASPGAADGDGFYPGQSEADMRALLQGCAADLIVVGHKHIPVNICVDGIRIVNPGSLSNPFPPDLRASYAILSADKVGYHIEHWRVDYDRQAIIAAARRVRHPAAEYIAKYMRGDNKR